MSELLFANLNPDYISYRQDLKYKTQVGLCVLEAFKKRGYTRGEDTYDIFWVEKEALDSFYANHRVMRDQRLNHFRTYFEICRKDNLNRNIKKYRRNLEKEGRSKEAAEYNFLPLTFHLPIEFTLFSDEFKKGLNSGKPNIWIMKPTARSQGKGIFLINKMSQVQEWIDNSDNETYICQKYIQNPLLIGHKKFDLRLYVLCTGYRPLNIYMYRQGFARFTHYRYDENNIASAQIHLTNVAIQKNTAQYSKFLGGKWILSNLKIYLLSKYGQEAVNACFYEIKNLVIKTLRGVSKLMSNEGNCFQLYGFDVMLDDTLKPWLIEVNGSPSMRANTKKDRDLKVGIIDDLLTVLDLEKILVGNEDCLGGFDLICRRDVNYESQYYLGSKVALLGCKLERQKNYRALATSLNNFHKRAPLNASPDMKKITDLRNSNLSNAKKAVLEIEPTSPLKKFSVRKPKRVPSISNQLQSVQRSVQAEGQELKLVAKINEVKADTPIITEPTIFRRSTMKSNGNFANQQSSSRSEILKSLRSSGANQPPQSTRNQIFNPEQKMIGRDNWTHWSKPS